MLSVLRFRFRYGDGDFTRDQRWKRVWRTNKEKKSIWSTKRRLKWNTHGYFTRKPFITAKKSSRARGRFIRVPRNTPFISSGRHDVLGSNRKRRLHRPQGCKYAAPWVDKANAQILGAFEKSVCTRWGVAIPRSRYKFVQSRRILHGWNTSYKSLESRNIWWFMLMPELFQFPRRACFYQSEEDLLHAR